MRTCNAASWLCATTRCCSSQTNAAHGKHSSTCSSVPRENSTTPQLPAGTSDLTCSCSRLGRGREARHDTSRSAGRRVELRTNHCCGRPCASGGFAAPATLPPSHFSPPRGGFRQATEGAAEPASADLARPASTGGKNESSEAHAVLG